MDVDRFQTGYSFKFTHPPTFSAVLDCKNFKCRDYYRFLIKCNYEKPKKWAKLRDEFDLEDQHIEKAFLLPQYKNFQ